MNLRQGDFVAYFGCIAQVLGRVTKGQYADTWHIQFRSKDTNTLTDKEVHVSRLDVTGMYSLYRTGDVVQVIDLTIPEADPSSLSKQRIMAVGNDSIQVGYIHLSPSQIGGLEPASKSIYAADIISGRYIISTLW